ncbi:MAG: alpha-mannosidase, partial [Fimbriimonadales bacterium]
MLKHPEITRRRLDLFLKQDILPRLYGERAPLKIEINERPAKDQNEAQKGPWREVKPGHRYGPAYTTFWFRLTGNVPPSMADREIAVVAELGGERTVWRDNSPWCGIDWSHTDMGFLDGSIFPSEASKVGRIEMFVQSYTRNPQVEVHIRERPREALVETVENAEVVVVDRDIKALHYDLEFTLSLLDSLDKDGPSYATLLRALNEVVNIFRPEARETIARSRKLIKETLGVLNGELKHTMVPVGHAHLDTAWLWPLDITKKKMAHTTATQLNLIDHYPEYVFVHSQASQYEWLEREYPALFKRVKEAIAKGQWEPVGSMWVEADCNLTGPESLVRQFLYGKRYFREKFGYETHDMWLPDVFGYAAALPQILTKFNIKYFLTQKISWNQFNKFPHHTFWWQGIDGTRIWTHFPPSDTYCGSCEPKQILFSVKNHRDHARSDHSLYVFGHGDGGGGPTERHLELLRRGRLAPHFPEIASGKGAIDFFREAKSRSRDLQTWVGELYGEFHRGTYTTQAANKRANRFSEFLLRDAEYLASFTEGFPKSYPTAKLEEAWKLVLLNQFHDIIPGSSVREVYVDSLREYEQVAKLGREVIDKSLKSIGAKLDTGSMSRPVALFQNCVSTIQGEIPWTAESVPQSLVCGDEALPVQLVDGLGERKLVFQTPVAALESVAVGDLSDAPPSQKAKVRGSGRKIETAELSVRLDGNGNIASILSLEDGTEFVEQGKLANLFQFLEDKPLSWSAWDTDVFAQETCLD